MLELNNICLNIGRFGHAVSSNVWDIVFCSKQIIDLNLFRRGGSSNFPLYLNHLTKKIQKTFFDSIERNDFIYNLDSAFIKEITHKLNVSFSKEKRDRWNSLTGKDVFHYTYSVLHAPTYRKRYIEFLRIDYPRLPLTGNKGLFAALVSLGAELVSLHLMESPYLEKLITRFPVPGSRVVEGVRFQESARRVYINSEQYFEGVPPEVWAFTIGGYQVCHKWLKDRKGRTLTFEDIQHYQKIIVALAETIRLMGEIDAAIEAHGGWPIS
jgi:predicted helicase